MPEGSKAAQQPHRVVGGTVTGQRAGGLDDQLAEQEEAGDPHPPDPGAFASTDRLIDIESDGLVLAFFQCVPEQNRPHFGVADQFLSFVAGENDFGECRRIVLQGGRHSQAHRGRKTLLKSANQLLDMPIDPLGGIAHRLEPIVEQLMLVSVGGLLCNESLDRLLEVSVADVVPVLAD